MLLVPNDPAQSQIPTHEDYENSKQDVLKFLASLEDFYKHEGIMEMFIKHEMESVVKVYCYLNNKFYCAPVSLVPQNIFTQEEQEIYQRLSIEKERLKQYDVNLDEYIIEFSNTNVRHALRVGF